MQTFDWGLLLTGSSWGPVRLDAICQYANRFRRCPEAPEGGQTTRTEGTKKTKQRQESFVATKPLTHVKLSKPKVTVHVGLASLRVPNAL
jgi:hypothetical protein